MTRTARELRAQFKTIVLMILACVFGPYLLPYNDLYIDLRARFSPPLRAPAMRLANSCMIAAQSSP